jgi:hypothetical protein
MQNAIRLFQPHHFFAPHIGQGFRGLASAKPSGGPKFPWVTLVIGIHRSFPDPQVPYFLVPTKDTNAQYSSYVGSSISPAER